MNGDLPIIGVNTLAPMEDAAPEQIELIRSTEEEKQRQIANLRACKPVTTRRSRVWMSSPRWRRRGVICSRR